MQCPTCGYMMTDFDRECPRCVRTGQAREAEDDAPALSAATAEPPRSRDASTGIAIAMLLIAVWFGYWWYDSEYLQPVRDVENAAEIAQAEADEAYYNSIAEPLLTYAMYQQIKVGMTYNEVYAIVGWHGKEVSKYENYTSISWQNGDGSNMLLMFDGNRVDSKAQAGLQ